MSIKCYYDDNKSGIFISFFIHDAYASKFHHLAKNILYTKVAATANAAGTIQFIHELQQNLLNFIDDNRTKHTLWTFISYTQKSSKKLTFFCNFKTMIDILKVQNGPIQRKYVQKFRSLSLIQNPPNQMVKNPDCQN